MTTYGRLGSAALAVTVLLPAVLGASSEVRPGTIEARVTDQKGKLVEDAVISLVPARAVASGARPTPAVMDQFDKEFIPYVLPISVGTPVNFPNRDDIRHHVYSFSEAKRFELPLYSGTPAVPVVFDKPGVVVLGCNIHDWMVGYIYVMTTPYFAKTGPDGVARLTDVPAGDHDVQVWHPRLQTEKSITVKPVTAAGETIPVSFIVTLKREWRAPRGPGRYERPQGG